MTAPSGGSAGENGAPPYSSSRIVFPHSTRRVLPSDRHRMTRQGGRSSGKSGNEDAACHLEELGPTGDNWNPWIVTTAAPAAPTRATVPALLVCQLRAFASDADDHEGSAATMITRECSCNFTPGSSGR